VPWIYADAATDAASDSCTNIADVSEEREHVQ
jgi:hypothetical protein